MTRRRVQNQRIAEIGAALFGNTWVRYQDVRPPGWFLRALTEKARGWSSIGRPAVTRARFEALLQRVAKAQYGVIAVDGGLEALARDLDGWPFSTMAQNMERWERAGIVRRTYGEGGRRQPPIVAVEVAPITEAFVWYVRGRIAALDKGDSEDSDRPTARQQRAIAYESVRVCAPWPPPDLTFNQAKGLLDGIAAYRRGEAEHPLALTNELRPNRTHVPTLTSTFALGTPPKCH